MNTSNLFKLNFNDISKGLLMAVLLPVISIVQQSLSAGILVFDYKTMVTTAVGGLLAYLVKNFVTNSQGLPFAPEPTPDVPVVAAPITPVVAAPPAQVIAEVPVAPVAPTIN